MKILIFTIIGRGPGTKLQNFALQYFLEKKYNAEVKTIRRNSYFYKKLSWKNMYGIDSIKTFIKFFINYKGYREWILKEKSVQDSWLDFDRNIHYTNYIKKENDGPIEKKIVNDFDYFFVGSDQIWNPNWYHDIDYFKYVNKNKQIAYAGSFGVYTIPDKLKDSFKRVFENMGNISVREEAGAKIIKELIGKDVPVVIDPTLLLDKNEWLKVSKKPEWIKEKKYILAFFLGDISNERRQIFDRLAKNKNLEIIYILKYDNIDWAKVGPAEFIYLVNNSEAIITDSYHGSVFSIIMHKPFFVFNREEKNMCNMNSRLETLLKKFNLENRYQINNNINEENLFHVDYSNMKTILEKEREYAINYLEKAMQ